VIFDKAIGVLGQAERCQPLRDRGHDLRPRQIPATLYPEQKAIAASIFARRSGEVGAKINLGGILQVYYSADPRGPNEPRSAQWKVFRVGSHSVAIFEISARGYRRVGGDIPGCPSRFHSLVTLLQSLEL
jgi:hypothetical protein